MASLSEALAAAFDHYASCRFAEAAELCRRILDVAPEQAGAVQVAGAALAALGRRRASRRAFEILLALRPADAGGWSNVGVGLAANQQSAAALAAYARASLCDPLLAEPRVNRAALLSQMGEKAGAADAATAALVRNPAHGGAAVNLADGRLGLKDAETARRWSLRAARLTPGAAQPWLTLAAALAAAGESARAAAAARLVLCLAPGDSGGLESLAQCLAKLGDAGGCDAALAKALTLDGPSDRLARAAVSGCLATARPEKALDWLDAPLRRAPNDAGLHWNRANALLQAGRWDEGWREFEWRRRDDRAQPPWRDLGVPAWTGAPFAGKRLLLYAEQGLGDALQMLRFVPLAAARGGEVILETQPPLAALARGVAGAAAVIERGDPLPPFDLECPLMTLPGVFGATPEAVPGAVPFLTADPARAAAWAQRLAPTDKAGGAPELRVGVVWAGNPRFADDRRRSPGFAALAPLMRAIPSVRFFGLQKGAGRRDLERADLPDNFHDLGQMVVDLDDTAAIMAQLDLVISSCTMPAHLAIAVGTPLWLALAHAPDWRWLLGRDDTPWSPRARLFRQTIPGDWTGPVERMTAELRQFSR